MLEVRYMKVILNLINNIIKNIPELERLALDDVLECVLLLLLSPPKHTLSPPL